MVGSSTYVYRVIENKQYLVLEKDPDNLDFTFQEKFDKATGKPFFVSVVTRSKVWELPDVATLPPMEPMPQEIASGCTIYKTCHSADGEIMFAPEKLPIDLAAGHCWVPQADQIYGKYTFRNAATGRRCVALPPTYDYCQRIQRMYAKYGIGTIPELNAFLTAHAGEEEAALATLVSKYGEEPKEYLHTKEQIVGVFSKFAPSRMGEVIELLEQHEGPEKEAALLRELQEKYGEIPKTYRERITDLFAKYAPEKLETISAVLNTFANREVGLLAALVRKYGSEPGDEVQPQELEASQRIVAMLIKSNVHNLNSVYEQGLAEFKKPSAFLETLLQKKGIEPTKEERDRIFDSYLSVSTDVSPGLVSSPSSPVLKPNIYKERLLRFYEKYNPGKLGSVDKMLRRYEGSEEQLMAELVKTYGPEPIVTDPSPLDIQPSEPEVTIVSDASSKPIEEPKAQSNTLATQQAMVPEVSPANDSSTIQAASDSVKPNEATAAPLPAYHGLTSDEVRQRIISIVLVNEPDTLEAVTLMVATLGSPVILYEELLAKYRRDPTPEEIREAWEAMERNREAERARQAQADEENRFAKESQRQQMSALAAEIEALRIQEAQRLKLEEIRKANEDAELQRRVIALGALSEAEARRKAAEHSVELIARTSEFVAHDETEDERFLKQQPTLTRADVSSISITTSLATADAATLIGTLAALEEKLQRAYNQMETSIRKGDALRRANDELHFEINELKTQMAEREKDIKVALIEAKNESDRVLNEQCLEKLQMKATEQATRAEILVTFREEQRKMSEDMLRMSQESNSLNEEVAKQRGEIRELERNIRSLQARLTTKEADELAARAKLKLLEDSMAVKPTMDTNFSQTEDNDVYSSQVFSSPRSIYTRAQQASIEELNATVKDLEGQLSAWRLKYAEAQSEAQTSKSEHVKMLEEYDTSLRVINMLRAKNKQLEAHVRALDLQNGDALHTPLKAQASPTALSTPRTIVSPKPAATALQTSEAAAVESSPTATMDLRRRLAASDAESRALKKEIMDLRGLLTLHMSSPKVRR